MPRQHHIHNDLSFQHNLRSLTITGKPSIVYQNPNAHNITGNAISNNRNIKTNEQLNMLNIVSYKPKPESDHNPINVGAVVLGQHPPPPIITAKPLRTNPTRTNSVQHNDDSVFVQLNINKVPVHTASPVSKPHIINQPDINEPSQPVEAPVRARRNTARHTLQKSAVPTTVKHSSIIKQSVDDNITIEPARQRTPLHNIANNNAVQQKQQRSSSNNTARHNRFNSVDATGAWSTVDSTIHHNNDTTIPHNDTVKQKLRITKSTRMTAPTSISPTYKSTSKRVTITQPATVQISTPIKTTYITPKKHKRRTRRKTKRTTQIHNGPKYEIIEHNKQSRTITPPVSPTVRYQPFPRNSIIYDTCTHPEHRRQICGCVDDSEQTTTGTIVTDTNSTIPINDTAIQSQPTNTLRQTLTSGELTADTIRAMMKAAQQTANSIAANRMTYTNRRASNRITFLEL